VPRGAVRLHRGRDWQLRNLRHEDGLTRWEVWHAGALWAELEMQLAGEHNALNATAAAALAAGWASTKNPSGSAGQLQEREAAA
jgi:UDP-N-acetylmuramate-alanine ligase